MIINEKFKYFLKNLAQNSHIWMEMFETLKKPLDFKKTSKTSFNNDQPGNNGTK